MKEKEIRPKKIFEKFLQLAALDTKKFFKSSKIKKNCVACGKKYDRPPQIAVSSDLELGWFDPPASSRRHLTKPIELMR